MSRADRGSEPSMDEILASIRKIIADEPGAKPARDAASQRHELAADFDDTLGDRDRGAASARKSNVDDILDLADDIPRREADPARGQGHANGEVPSWLFPAKRSGSSAEGRRLPAGDNGSDGETPRPFFNSGPGQAPARETQRPSRAEARANPPRESVDLGAFVPQRAADAETPPGQRNETERTPERRLPQTRLPERARQAAAAAGLTTPGPVPTPAEPTRIVQEPTDLEASGPASPPSAEEVQKNLGRPAEVAEQALEPVPQEKTEAPAARAAEPAAPRAGPSTAEAPASSPSAATVASSAAAAAMVAAPAAGTPEAPAKPEAEAALPAAAQPSAAPPPAAVPVAAEPAAVPVPKPTVLTERARPARNGAASEPMQAATQATGVRTLEDTVVDLLRPMIRQWLDDNMPRMVEKALRIELAASAKGKDEAPRH